MWFFSNINDLLGIYDFTVRPICGFMFFPKQVKLLRFRCGVNKEATLSRIRVLPSKYHLSERAEELRVNAKE